MNRIVPSWIVLIFLVSAFSGPRADDPRTLTGEFVWNQRDTSGDLEAVFTPSGEGEWDVSFHFSFRGRPHTYEGTAEGSLSQGALKGRVKNESGSRTFTFEGQFTDGEFRGLFRGHYADGNFRGQWVSREGERGALGGRYRESVPGPETGGEFIGRWAETSCDARL